MRKFLLLVFIFLSGCSYSGDGSPDDPVKAEPMIIESTDGSRYKCQGIETTSYGGYQSLTLIDCEEIKK